MGKRYYCDYCDKTLPYSVEARKKHNTGHQHRQARKAYYDQLKTERETLEKNIPSQLLGGVEPSLESVKPIFEKSTSSFSKIEEIFQSYCQMNPHFVNYHPLPPSLQGLTTESILNVKYNSWG